MRMRSGMVVVVAVAGVLLAGGCSVETYRSISGDQLEQQVSDALAKKVGTKPDKVECPDELKIRKDEKTRCVVSSDGMRYGSTVTVTSVGENGKFNFFTQVDQQPMR